MLRRARVQLTLRHPFLASATLRLAVQGCAGTVVVSDDGHRWLSHLLQPRLGWRAVAPDSCMGVIAHEVLHAVLGHADRRGSRHA